MELLLKMLANETPLQNATNDLKSSLIERLELLTKFKKKTENDIDKLTKIEEEKDELISSLKFVISIIHYS